MAIQTGEVPPRSMASLNALAPSPLLICVLMCFLFKRNQCMSLSMGKERERQKDENGK